MSSPLGAARTATRPPRTTGGSPGGRLLAAGGRCPTSPRIGAVGDVMRTRSVLRAREALLNDMNCWGSDTVAAQAPQARGLQNRALDFLSLIGYTPTSDRKEAGGWEDWIMLSFYRLEASAADRRQSSARWP